MLMQRKEALAVLKLTEEERQEAKRRVRKELDRLIGNAPRGLTLDELQECWQDILASWFTITKERR